MDFSGIYNSIITALGKSFGVPSADIKSDTTKKKVTFATEESDQTKIAVFKKQKSPSSPPPTSSPPPPPKKCSVEKGRVRGRGRGKRERERERKGKSKSVLPFWREDKIKENNIEENKIVEKYLIKNNRNKITKSEVDSLVDSFLVNLNRYKAFLKLANLSRQDTSATSIKIGQYTADRDMLADKSPEMRDWSKFRSEHKELFTSLAKVGLDPLNQNNQQGGRGGRGR